MILQDKSDEIVNIDASLMTGVAKTIIKTEMKVRNFAIYPAIGPTQAKSWTKNLNLVQNLENALFLIMQ